MNKIKLFRSKIYLFVLIVIISFFISLGGFLFYSNEKTELLAEKKSELKTISELKRAQISRWLNERYADVSVISSSPFFSEAIEEWLLHQSNSQLKNKIYNRLSTPQAVYGYNAILLISSNDKILLTVGDSTETINKKVKYKSFDFKNSNDINYSDFYYCDEKKEIHFDIIAPILNRSRQPIAKIVFRIDPNKFLYPFIQTWPTNSTSSETILVKKHKNNVLFLNELRHKKNTALNYSFPADKTDLQAAKAVSGYKGFFEGTDYRAVQVISYLNFIPETQWFMITKVDKEELLQPLYFKSFVIIMISSLSILIVALTLITIYNRKQKNIFRSLYSTQQEFKTTLYSIGDAVITTDNLGRVLHLNKVAENLTGWTENEAQGLDLESVFKIINEDTREIVENPVTKVLSEGITINLANHTLLISKDGTETPIADSGAPIKNNENEIFGAVLVFRDQSEERNKQKILEENEAKYKSLFTSTNDGVCLHELVFDTNGNPIDYTILDINKKYEEITGLSKENVIGKLATVLYQTSHAPYLDQYSSVALTGNPVRFETHFPPMNKYFLISVYSPAKNKFATVFQDITQQKLADELLRKSETLFRTTLYSIGDAVITTNSIGQVQQLNKVAETLTGWKETDAKGKNLEEVFEIINEETRQKVENPVTKVLKDGSIVSLANHTLLVAKDGTETPIADSGAPITNEAGEIIGVVLVFRDQSEERKTQKFINSRLKLYACTNTPSLDELLTKVIDVVCDITKSPIGFYHLVNEDENNLTLQAWSTQTQQAFCKAEGKGLHYPVDQAGVWVDCVKERKAVIHNDYNNLPNKKGLPEGHAPVIRELVLPILRKNKIVAILGVGNKPKDYDERDIETVEYLADIIWEIAEQKRAQIALKESEEKFRLFYENSPVAYQSLDINGNILEVNKAWLDLLGFQFHEILGRNISELLTSESKNKLENYFKKFIDQGSINNVEYSIIAKDGTIFEISVSGAIEKNSDGSFSRTHCVLHNITSLKKHEIELEKAAAEWKITFDSTTDGIILLNNDLQILKINKSMSKLFSKKTDEVVGYALKDSLINTRINTNENLFNEVRNSKKRKSEVQKSGDMWLEYIIEPILFNNDKVNGFVLIIRNVTDQTINEFIKNLQYQIANATLTTDSVNELFESIRASLSEFLDVTNFFMAFYDEETKMLRSNIDKDEKDKIPEWPAEKSLTGLVVKNQKPLLASKQMIEKFASDGVIDIIGTIPEVWIGYPIKIKDKSLGAVVVQSYDNPYAYDNSSLEVLEIVVKELSHFLERKIAEENALKLSKSIEQSPVSIVITDVKGKIEYVNPKFTEVSGYTFKEVFGQNPSVLRSGFQSKEFYETLWSTILSGKDWHGEVLNKKKSGDDFWESVIISPIINDHDDITHFVAVKEDITEKKKILEDLIDAKEKAEEMNKVKSVFFANMSHELRTPFVGILGYAHLLLDTITDPEAKEMVEGIIRASNRLTNTLSMILDLTKLEFEKTEVKIIGANVIDIIDEVYKQFSKAALQKNIEFRKKYNFDNLTVQTDPNLLIHVLINLVNNAVKFTDKGFIEVEADYSPAKNSKTVFIKVIDSGLGIPVEKQQLIWEEFRQVSEGTTRGYQGTGLGLSIAKKYIELLGGKISLVSKEGEGSSFIIELPLKQKIKIAKPLTPVVLDKEIPKPSEQKNSKKILYIEDDFSSRDVIRRFLSNEYAIELADGPDSALHFIRENIYDCILMDINLGTEINGVQLTQIIKKIPGYADVPVIAVTAFASYDDKKAFHEKGLNYYIAKPFMKHELLELIDTVFTNN